MNAPSAHRLRLRISTAPLSVCRLDRDAPVPAWAVGPGFVSITRAGSELSVVCAEDRVPAAVKAERGYVAIAVEGPLAPELVGVLVSLAVPLAAAAIPILAIGTFDTDYVLVRGSDLERALAALGSAGHDVVDVT